jgi:uncharacterized protein YqgV (UPF0045/DUF77 family)
VNIQAEVSIYPLGINKIGEPINNFIEELKDSGLVFSTGPMSTILAGNADSVFTALKEAFKNIAENHQAVLVMKISNACPVEKD